MSKPVLLLACGNLSRGDDALGPLLLEYVEEHCDLSAIELLSEFQLQIEHALDLENRELVLFVDAAVSCPAPFDFCELAAMQDNSYTTHAMSPESVMAVYQSVLKRSLPPCFLLAIKGGSFELGDGLSTQAEENLQQACSYLQKLLSPPDVTLWRQRIFNRSADSAEYTITI